MNRRVILIGAGVLVAVMVILLIKINSGDTASERRTQTADPVATNDVTPTSGKVRRDHPAKPDDSADDKKPTIESDGSDDYTETVINGVRVRDHRKNKKPIDLPPNIHHPDQKKLPSTLVFEISNKLSAIMKECAAGQIPKESRGAKPKMDGTVFVDIKGGTLTVTEAVVQIRDVTSDTAPIKQCMEQKSVGQNVPSGTTEDTTHYSISIAYTIPES
jgi:hypothetical protein